MCCGILQQAYFDTGGNLLRPAYQGPFKTLARCRGTIASAFATPSTWEGYAGRNFETELASFLVPGFPARGITARERNASAASREKRAATVDVLVFGWEQGRSSSRWLRAPIQRQVQALFR